MPVVDARFEIGDQLLQRGAQRVIDGFGQDVRPRRDEMRRNAEGRAGFEPSLDENAGLVDLQRLAERFDLLLDKFGEGWGRLMVAMLKDEFHDGPNFSARSSFDKDAFSHLPLVFMESSEPASEWLNYHHLRYFHAVAKEGSVSRAAAKLCVSQPSICAQVKQLEAALGETLYRRSGRSIQLTDFGRTIHGYAEEILALGSELLTLARRAPSTRTQRLHVGIVDSFPKLLGLDILRPVFAQVPTVHVICHEGKLDDLLGQLAAHRLDVLLSDEPPPSSTKIKTFNHTLGASGVTFCASPAFAQTLKGRFPRNLHGAHLLLPTQNTALRRDLEKWFRTVEVEPVVVGEFEDAAFAKIVATEGIGITVVPTIVAAEAIERYGFARIGKTDECQMEFHLITVERRLEHPIVALLAREAASTLRGRSQKARPAARPTRRKKRH